MVTKYKNKLDEASLDLPRTLPKTAIIGSSGFLGSAFLAAYRHIHPDCIATTSKPKSINNFFIDLIAPDIRPLDLTKTGHKEALILAAMPKICICETDRELTWRVNVTGTLELIRQLVNEGIKPIFTSSDYVFDGSTGSYADNSPTNPITEYGRQKAEVEARIGEITNGNYLVVRISKIFSLKKGDGTLLDEMASVLMSGGIVRAAYDQIFCPMSISDLIRIVAKLQTHKTTGIINVCSPKAYSRYDLALEMAEALGIDSSRVSRISLDELGLIPKRPKNTSMKIDRLLGEIQCEFTPMLKYIEQVAQNWREGCSGK